MIDYNLTYSFSPVELLFCFMECPGVFTIFSLKDLLFVPAHCNQFLHHGDVSFNLVMHECDLFILFLSFADGLSVAFNLCFDGLDSLSLKTVKKKRERGKCRDVVSKMLTSASLLYFGDKG